MRNRNWPKLTLCPPFSLASTTFSANNQYYPPLHHTTEHHQSIFLPKTTHHCHWQHLKSMDWENFCGAIYFFMQILVLQMHARRYHFEFLHKITMTNNNSTTAMTMEDTICSDMCSLTSALLEGTRNLKNKMANNATSLILPKRKKCNTYGLSSNERKTTRSLELHFMVDCDALIQEAAGWQMKIGWMNLMEGKLAKKWMTLQQAHYECSMNQQSAKKCLSENSFNSLTHSGFITIRWNTNTVPGLPNQSGGFSIRDKGWDAPTTSWERLNALWQGILCTSSFFHWNHHRHNVLGL